MANEVVRLKYGPEANLTGEAIEPGKILVAINEAGERAKIFFDKDANNRIPVADDSWSVDASNIVGITQIINGGTGGNTTTTAKANLGLGDAKIYHAVCNTAAATAAKVASTDDSAFTNTLLVKGAIVFVTFNNTNSAAVASLTLQVGTSTAKPIKHQYNANEVNLPAANFLRANQTYLFYYDNTNWVLVTDYSSADLHTTIFCTTAAGTSDKVGTSSGYTLLPGYFAFWLLNGNTAATALTLNISSAGAKPVYLNGSATSSMNYTWPQGYYIGFYDGTRYHFRTDASLPVNYGEILPSTGNEGLIFYQVSNESFELPTGGSTGTLLMKNSFNDRDVVWTPASIYVSGTVLFGAAWNDYAEYRDTADEIEPGRVVIENGDDTLSLSTGRLLPGAEIVSDTFGFAIGQTEKCKTPIASSGRVLAYPYESRETYKPGQPVCSGPEGTVSLMTDEEARLYPWLIIGTVSSIPNYEYWGEENIKVNGRIWIRIR